VTHRVRPYSSLFRQGLISSLIFMTTVFVVLYFLTVPDGPWALVVGVQAIVTVAISLAAVGYFSATIWVSRSEIVERGFFGGRHRFTVGSIDSIVLANTASSGGEVIRQLFVRDAEGRQLVRMRGQFWSPESFDLVIRTLDVPVVKIEDVTTIRELRDQFPGLLFWFERHPVRAIIVMAVSTVAIGAGVYIFLKLIHAV
jgi:hypothetical protein